MARDFINTFLNDMRERKDTLYTTYKQGDAKEFHRAAHSLKSLSGQVGAVRLSLMSEQLEQMGLDIPQNGVLEQVDQIAMEFTLVEEALTREGEAL